MPSDRVTETVRVYRGDKAKLERMARNQAAEQDRNVTPADVIRGLLASAQPKERGSGTNQTG